MNPPHTGPLVKEKLDAPGRPTTRGAEGLGVTRQQFYRAINWQSAIFPEMAVCLEKTIGSTVGSIAHNAGPSRPRPIAPARGTACRASSNAAAAVSR
jgi:hypothetical protein